MKKRKLRERVRMLEAANSDLRLELKSLRERYGFFRLLLKIGPREQTIGSWHTGVTERGVPFIEMSAPSGCAFTVIEGDTLRVTLPCENVLHPA